MTSVEVIRIGKKHFDTAVLEEPEFVRFLAVMMARRARQQSEKLMLMRLGNSPLKVLMGLAHYAETICNDLALTVMDYQTSVVDIPIGQHQIAALCGVSRTLFSEYIQLLACAGWLKLRYCGVEIQFVETWQIFANKQRAQLHMRRRPTIADLLIEMDSAQAERGPSRFPNLMPRNYIAPAQAGICSA